MLMKSSRTVIPLSQNNVMHFPSPVSATAQSDFHLDMVISFQLHFSIQITCAIYNKAWPKLFPSHHCLSNLDLPKMEGSFKSIQLRSRCYVAATSKGLNVRKVKSYTFDAGDAGYCKVVSEHRFLAWTLTLASQRIHHQISKPASAFGC